MRLWQNNIVFDSNENYFYYWLALVSTAYIFNLLVGFYKFIISMINNFLGSYSEISIC